MSGWMYLEPGVPGWVVFVCTRCGEEVNVRMPLDVEQLIPAIEDHRNCAPQPTTETTP